MLTIQSLLICTVLQDAFENLWASLLFDHTFLDPNLSLLFIRKNLIGAAKSHLPRAINIYKDLLINVRYLDKLSRLISVSPSVIIYLITSLAPCLYTPFLSGSKGVVCQNHADLFCHHHASKHCCWDSWNTTVTVSLYVPNNQKCEFLLSDETVLTSSKANGHQLPPMRTWPYRNTWIITVIRDLYFTGGMQSFFHCFVRYVPIPSFWECESMLPLNWII
jgi:hypothetical protein